MTPWELISTGISGSDRQYRRTTSPARAGTGETGNGPVGCLTSNNQRVSIDLHWDFFNIDSNILVRTKEK